MGDERTSVGFGGGEVVVIYQSLEKATKLFQKALNSRAFLELTNESGESIVINPFQVKVLQPASPPPSDSARGEAEK